MLDFLFLTAVVYKFFLTFMNITITNGTAFHKKPNMLYTSKMFVGAKNPFRQTILSIREIAISMNKFLNCCNSNNKHFTHPTVCGNAFNL